MATKKGKTETGLEPKVAGLLCYVLGWVSGLVFLFLEKKDKFVRFHAIQSIIVFGALSVVGFVLGMLTLVPFVWILFLILSYIIGAFALVLWIVLMIKAYQGEKFKLPISGDIAARNA
jgi:uncharacterized membrane protein